MTTAGGCKHLRRRQTGQTGFLERSESAVATAAHRNFEAPARAVDQLPAAGRSGPSAGTATTERRTTTPAKLRGGRPGLHHGESEI